MNSDSKANFWNSTLSTHTDNRPHLDGDNQADIVIIGAGFTGLWTAYYLKSLAPELEIAILEAEHVGHGASGRNGGWVIGSIAGLQRHIGHLSQRDKRNCCRILVENVDAIGSTLDDENIHADFHKGGAVYAAARYRDQIGIQRDFLKHMHELGHEESDCYWLDAAALKEKAHFRNGYGGVFHRQVATINPAKVVSGLAAAVEKLGVTIYEHSRATHIGAHEVVTTHGNVEASTIVCATEGYAGNFEDFRRYIIPVQSLIIATEPLSDELWAQVGLTERPVFADASRMVNYGHRSADGRIVFGARGAYHFGAKPKINQSISEADIRLRRDLLADLFPALANVKAEFGWGGSVGLSRNFRPHAIYDKSSGLATAGGYAGEGVAASHLFGRTLADLILDRDTELVHMPWALANTTYQQSVKRWEPEPLRWLTAQTISYSYASEEALMHRNKKIPLVHSALTRINDVFASFIE